jgi:penicillin-binding protein 1A
MSENYRSRVERKQAVGKSKNQKPKKKKRGIAKKIILVLLAVGIIGMITGATTFYVLAKDAPPLDEALLKDPLSSKVLDRNGNTIYEFGVEKRTYVTTDEIPKIMKEAVIAVEDARFYEHHGLDVVRLGGAVVANFQEGFGAEGASTISQQVIKNSFLSPEKTIKRKAQELWLAFQLEQKYTKDQILEMYLNKIYYGVGNTHGVAKASEVYFGKPLNELELHEAALIAGMGQNPGIYNPFKNPENAENRRNIVLTLMERHGFITADVAAEAKKIPIESSIVEALPESQPIESYLDQVKKEIAEYDEEIDVYSAGLTIHTSFDPEAQEYIDTILNTDEVLTYPSDDFQAGIAVTDTKNGEILALGGGRNQSENSRINFAIDASNQPGSTIKPILDYGPAVEHLQWSTYQQIKDEPYTYSDGTPINNYDQGFKGQMTIRYALQDSRNIPALKALQEVGLEKAREFAVNLGMPFDKPINEAYAIGGIEGGISPLQMAGAYSAFGNEGNYNQPHAVNKITFEDDTEIVMAPETKSVMKDSTAFLITDMLKTVMTSGTGRGANVSGLHIAGKTGTTNYDKSTRERHNISSGAVPDAWMAGYTPEYTVAVWTGYRDNNVGLEYPDDQQYAKKIFQLIMTQLSEGKETSDFPVPNSVERIGVEKGSNPAKLPSKFTPKDQIVYEYFIKGTGPTGVSEKYNELTPPGNVNATYNQEQDELTLTWSYPEDKIDGVNFEVSQSIDEGSYSVISTGTEMSISIPEPTAGTKYSFKIVAISTKNSDNQSKPTSTVVEIPEKPEGDLGDSPPMDGLPGDENDPGDGEGENEGNDNGNGNGEGEAEGNGDQDEAEEDQNGDGLPDIIAPPNGENEEQQDTE